MRNYIDLKKIRPARFKVIMDAMHGSGDSLIAQVLKGTAIRLPSCGRTSILISTGQAGTD